MEAIDEMEEQEIQWPLGFGMRDLVGAGITGMVVRLDAVIKFANTTESHVLERERLIYQRLVNGHTGIVRYYGVLDYALVLQYASHGSIRQYLAEHEQPVLLSLRLRWVEQIFDAVRFIHSKGVFHGDISCNNVFLDDHLNTKLGDFAGSAIDDCPPLVCYETRYDLPHAGDSISAKTELFALGSTIYEIMNGNRPY